MYRPENLLASCNGRKLGSEPDLETMLPSASHVLL
jgi:hypothetical protein